MCFGQYITLWYKFTCTFRALVMEVALHGYRARGFNTYLPANFYGPCDQKYTYSGLNVKKITEQLGIWYY